MALDLGQDLSAGGVGESDREFAQAQLEQRKDLAKFRRCAFWMAIGGAAITWLMAVAGFIKLLCFTQTLTTQMTALVGVTFSVAVVLMLTTLRAVFSRPKDAGADKEIDGVASLVQLLAEAATKNR